MASTVFSYPGDGSCSGLRPVLALDIDGVVLPCRRPRAAWDAPGWFMVRPEFREVRVAGMRAHVADHLTVGLGALSELFSAQWATSWEGLANGTVTELFGWGELPVIPVYEVMRAGGSRLDAVGAATDPRAPLAWCDDTGITAAARRWAQERPGPTLLIRPIADRGLTPRHLTQLAAFGATHTPAKP